MFGCQSKRRQRHKQRKLRAGDAGVAAIVPGRERGRLILVREVQNDADEPLAEIPEHQPADQQRHSGNPLRHPQQGGHCGQRSERGGAHLAQIPEESELLQKRVGGGAGNHNHNGDAEPRAIHDAEHVGIRQWIAEERLQQESADRDRRAGKDSVHGADQPELLHDLQPGSAFGFACEQDSHDFANGDGHRSDRQFPHQ